MRVVKIIDEFSVGAEEQLKEFEDHIQEMEEDNAERREEVWRMRNNYVE